MNKDLKVGIKIKQVKPIEKYNFDYVGTEFEITKITDEIVLFVGAFGQGGIGTDEFDTYFEIVKEKTERPFITGDEILITNGIFKGIKGKIYVLDSCCRIAKVKVEDCNVINISFNDIELIKKNIIKENYTDDFYLDNWYVCDIKIRGRRTTVKIRDYNVSGSVYCYKEDEYNKDYGVNKAFKKALIKLFEKEINE